MAHFMIEIELPNPLPEIIINMIPDQREVVDRLQGEGIIVSYTLSADRSKLWVIMHGETEDDVNKVIQQFPIKDYIKHTTHSLAFHEHTENYVPGFSLN